VFAPSFGLDQGDVELVADWNNNLDMCVDAGSRALGKPASRRQKARQHIPLKDRTGAAVPERSGPLGDDQGLELEAKAPQLRPVGRLLTEQEPEEAVGSERHVVRSVADGRKFLAAEHLDRQSPVRPPEIGLAP